MCRSCFPRCIDAGDFKVADQLLPLVYEELRKLASWRMAREAPGQTLQATALVHEAYLRLIGQVDQPWQNSRHFFSAAAEAMRRILVERARQKARQKYGGNCVSVAGTLLVSSNRLRPRAKSGCFDITAFPAIARRQFRGDAVVVNVADQNQKRFDVTSLHNASAGTTNQFRQ